MARKYRGSALRSLALQTRIYLPVLAVVATIAGAAAQPAPIAPKVPRAPDNAFVLAPWASLSQGQSLIRDPARPSSMDLSAGEDETYVTVYARKKAPDFGTGRRVDGDEPGYSDAATPWTLPIVPPTSCGGSAYQTIGGQPGTGADMVGGLARGC
jgi:hypothetical protein